MLYLLQSVWRILWRWYAIALIKFWLVYLNFFLGMRGGISLWSLKLLKKKAYTPNTSFTSMVKYVCWSCSGVLEGPSLPVNAEFLGEMMQVVSLEGPHQADQAA